MTYGPLVLCARARGLGNAPRSEYCITGAHNVSRSAGRPPLAWRKRRPTYVNKYTQILCVYTPSSNMWTSSANMYGTRKLTNRATMTTKMHRNCRNNQQEHTRRRVNTYSKGLQGEALRRPQIGRNAFEPREHLSP